MYLFFYLGSRGFSQIVNCLLNHSNIDVNWLSRDNFPLLCAVLSMDVEIVKQLLAMTELNVNLGNVTFLQKNIYICQF